MFTAILVLFHATCGDICHRWRIIWYNIHVGVVVLNTASDYIISYNKIIITSTTFFIKKI